MPEPVAPSQNTPDGTTAVNTPAGTQSPAAVVPAVAQQTANQTAQALHASVQQQVTSAVDVAMAPLQQTMSELSQGVTTLTDALTQAVQPKANANGSMLYGSRGQSASTIFGDLPSVCENNGYSYYKAYGWCMGQVDDDKCKLEQVVSKTLYDHYKALGFQFRAGTDQRSLVVPLGTCFLSNEFGGDMTVESRQFLHDVIAQGIRGADADRLRHMVNQQSLGDSAHNYALSQWDETALASFMRQAEKGEFIDLLRAREVMLRAGATERTLPASGHLEFSRATGDPTVYWIGEDEAITTSAPTTGNLEMRARTLGCLVDIPHTLIMFGDPSLELFIRNAMSRKMSLEMDSTFLEAPLGNTKRPGGLINYAGVNTYIASTTASNGDTFEPKDIALMQSVVEDANHDPTVDGWSWVMRGKMWANIKNRRAAAHTAGTYDGNFLFDTRNDISAAGGRVLQEAPVVTSNQVSNTRAKGSGSDLTYILGGVFPHFHIGFVGVMEFARSVEGDNFAKASAQLRALMHCDGVPIYEDAFAFCDDIDMDLPA